MIVVALHSIRGSHDRNVNFETVEVMFRQALDVNRPIGLSLRTL